jgi:hypothetical protein
MPNIRGDSPSRSSRNLPAGHLLGVVTCDGPAYPEDDLMKIVEDLVSAAGETGANSVKFKTLDLTTTDPESAAGRWMGARLSAYDFPHNALSS